MEYTKDELKEIISLHAKWEVDNDNGERADFFEKDLSYADLSYADLRHMSFNSADLSHSNLCNSTLQNVSLIGANFYGAQAIETNFVDANLSCIDFTHADVYFANFVGAYMIGAIFFGDRLTKNPIFINNLEYPITITDTKIKIGCKTFSTEQWENFTDDEIYNLDREKAVDFWDIWKIPIITMAKAHQ